MSFCVAEPKSMLSEAQQLEANLVEAVNRPRLSFADHEKSKFVALKMVRWNSNTGDFDFRSDFLIPGEFRIPSSVEEAAELKKKRDRCVKGVEKLKDMVQTTTDNGFTGQHGKLALPYLSKEERDVDDCARLELIKKCERTILRYLKVIKAYESAILRMPTIQVSISDAQEVVEKSMIDDTKNYPNGWLPIDTDALVKLQLRATHRTGPNELVDKDKGSSVYVWTGFLSNGVGMSLSRAYVGHNFSKGIIGECITECFEKHPNNPVDCSKVGAAASASPCGLRDRASASPTGVVGAHKICYSQGDKDYCVAYSTASALSFTDRAAGRTIAALAPRSLETKDRVKFVQTQCVERLQPAWVTRKLKAVHGVVGDVAMLLSLRPDRVTVLCLVDSGGSSTHCVATTGGWVFDANQKYAVPLTMEGLDSCCLGGATCAGARCGFELVPIENEAGRPPPKRHCA